MGSEESGICLENYCLVERSLAPQINNKTCAGFPGRKTEVGWWDGANGMPSAPELRSGGALCCTGSAPKGEGWEQSSQTPRAANHGGGSLGSVHPHCSHLHSTACMEIIPAPFVTRNATDRMSFYSK